MSGREAKKEKKQRVNDSSEKEDPYNFLSRMHFWENSLALKLKLLMWLMWEE